MPYYRTRDKDVIKSTIRRAQTIASHFRFLTPKSMNKI